MNKFFFILLILSFSLGCKTQEKSNDHEIPVTIIDTIQQSDHLIINTYKNGLKDGLWREYYNNGQLKSEGSYSNGYKEGLHKEWFENGILSLEGYYENNLANGEMKWYHEKGHLAATEQMKNNIRTGLWKIYDIEDGKIGAEGEFENGKEIGVWKSFHENGKVSRENIWENRQVISSKCWDENGTEIECNMK